MTTLSESDVLAIIGDTSKVIEGDIEWQAQSTMRPAQRFRAPVSSEVWDGLMLQGCFSPAARKLSYTLFIPEHGRIYGLDLGAEHVNPDGKRLVGTHKVRWMAEHGDRLGYVPADITAEWSEPVLVWQQFCAEASLRHTGTMIEPMNAEEMMP